MIHFMIEGMEELGKELSKASEEVRKKAEQAVENAAIRVTNEMRNRIARQGYGMPTGQFYTRSNPRRTGIASAEGEPPMGDQGQLIGGIMFEHRGLESYVYSKAKYSAALEFGMERPFFVPSLEEDAENFRDELAGML